MLHIDLKVHTLATLQRASGIPLLTRLPVRSDKRAVLQPPPAAAAVPCSVVALVLSAERSVASSGRRRSRHPRSGHWTTSAPPTALRAAGRRSRGSAEASPLRGAAAGGAVSAGRGRRLVPRRPPRSARPGAALALRAEHGARQLAGALVVAPCDRAKYTTLATS
jgi:hypothetical protein